MKLAYLSPMPPARSGVADYSAGLVAGLRKRANVEVVERPLPGYDSYIYQIGNNPLHLSAYRGALERPGVTVLHDAVLHHLLLGSLREEEYVEEFAYNYGEWMRGLGCDLWRSRSRSGADARYYEYPMLRRIVERSRVVVVHNPAARRRVEQAVPAAPVVEIPHYFLPPRLPGAAQDTRARLGIASDEIVIGTFGYLRDSKRIGSVLRALDAVSNARLLLAGEFVSGELERALDPWLRPPRVIRRRYVPEPEFWRLAEITDICVNLRWPAAGETSGIAIRMMGIGKPVVVTSSEENAGYPDPAVLRVDPGEPEIEMLAHYLRLLADSPEIRREIGLRAARHVAAHHTLDAAVEAYLQAAQAASGSAIRS